MDKKQNLTIDDIAQDLGVSKTTVSRAISGKGRISAATRARVREYIQRINYRPNASAKGLAESKTYNIALVLPKSLFKLDHPFIRQSMGAICEEAFLQDYNILLCLTTDEQPATLLRTLDNRKVDGVILARTVENDALIGILKERGIPFATMGSLHILARGQATVEADHDQVGGCRAFSIEFLQRTLGSKVALLGNDMNYIVNQSRYNGFYQAVRLLSLPEEEAILRSGLNSAEACAAAVEELLRQGVTAFLTMDDELCLHTYEHLLSLGLHIPEDIRLASLYDSDQLEAISVSALHFDAAELGRAACRELLRHLRKEEYQPSPTLGYRILMRNSL